MSNAVATQTQHPNNASNSKSKSTKKARSRNHLSVVSLRVELTLNTAQAQFLCDRTLEHIENAAEAVGVVAETFGNKEDAAVLGDTLKDMIENGRIEMKEHIDQLEATLQGHDVEVDNIECTNVRVQDVVVKTPYQREWLVLLRDYDHLVQLASLLFIGSWISQRDFGRLIGSRSADVRRLMGEIIKLGKRAKDSVSDEHKRRQEVAKAREERRQARENESGATTEDAPDAASAETNADTNVAAAPVAAVEAAVQEGDAPAAELTAEDDMPVEVINHAVSAVG